MEGLHDRTASQRAIAEIRDGNQRLARIADVQRRADGESDASADHGVVGHDAQRRTANVHRSRKARVQTGPAGEQLRCHAVQKGVFGGGSRLS